MAKKARGRPPAGEYREKSQVINFRIRADTLRLLKAAARRSKRSTSQQAEHELRRALVDMGGPLHAIVAPVTKAMETVIVQSTPAPRRWHEDPLLFDRVLHAFTAALAMFRPPGPVPPEGAAHEMDRLTGRAALLDMLAQITGANFSLALSKQPVQERQLSLMKQDLGQLIARPILDRLIPLALKAANNPAKAAEEDARELWRYIGRLAELRGVAAARIAEDEEET